MGLEAEQRLQSRGSWRKRESVSARARIAVAAPHYCSIGLLVSEDGVRFEHVVDRPVFTPEMLGFPHGSIQDPRVVKLDERYTMTFATIDGPRANGRSSMDVAVNSRPYLRLRNASML